ncbi:hypothetical protein HanRHA438_Chr09g0398291 [Helianthus annuus]|uniref:Uncharacterized protein n=1 Tax=Helianthus annuus TaxID=4232 RepID=A0A251TV11_HELAN|nr:hypothetical protein HanXRQr2_Chr09g0386631 [Helianthus annuus]KAJ0525921.1 hypothetical protein HanHA300_Chr09g0317461 [Helianthus annuus]KAJ0534205.1 hypothetical protein HanIR_Chr09g0417101 [Helianthus annuus]KAJ0542316.1 hypothetical protein HanHA89_Chr09g0338431 [Helianthus annuus]KAJ0707359.1 hypothetical protein HanLR1_Chr09g0317581 [Helianthus annuus]
MFGRSSTLETRVFQLYQHLFESLRRDLKREKGKEMGGDRSVTTISPPLATTLIKVSRASVRFDL